MNLKVPEILLVLYIFLPVTGNALIAQVLLCQVKSIRLSQRAERALLQEDETEQGLKDLLRSLWFSGSNTTAYAYFMLLEPNFISTEAVDVGVEAMLRE
ncbi:MAG: hypothetical protein AAGL17_23095 [Cyanobacteria bacterium J06576_12]